MALTELQVKERVKYIGGTDAAAIFGLSRWRSPLDVWAEKTGTVEPDDISGKVAVRLGTKLEAAVADMFCEDTGKKVHKLNETVYHPQYPFIAANIDRKVDGESALLECKTTNAFKGKEWDGEEIPAEYICQVTHYLACTGYKKAYLACLIGNQDLKIREIHRDEQMIRQLIDKEVYFWKNFVEPKIMPDTIMAQDDEILLKLYPRAVEGQTIQLGDDVNRIIESITSLTADKKTIENELKKLQNTLKSFVKENEVGTTGLYTVKWTNVHKDEHTVKASDYRMLKYRKIEEKEN